MIKLDDISFDESYKNLFQVDDARLRADALKHSVVPRLRVVLDNCIAWIDTIYNINVLEDSRISCFPNFRMKREKEINFLYESAYASLGGKKNKYKWLGVNRKDGKVVQVLPFRYGFSLEEEGLCFQIENYWLKGLTDESYRKFFDFHLEYESLIHSLCYQADIKPILYYGYDCQPISTFRDHYKWMAHNRYFDNDFVSKYFKYPISSDEIHILVHNYVFFYPIYDSYIQIALGKPVRFLELVGRLNKWIKVENQPDENEINENSEKNIDEFSEKLSESDILKAKLAAEKRVKVMHLSRKKLIKV